MEEEDKKLRAFVQETMEREGPSMAFSPEIMRKIEAKKSERLRPILSKKAWIIVTTWFSAFILIAFMSSNPFAFNYYWNEVSSFISIEWKHFTLPLMICIVIISFILIDILLQRRRKTLQK